MANAAKPDDFARELALARVISALRLLSALSADAARGALVNADHLALTLDLIAEEAVRAEA